MLNFYSVCVLELVAQKYDYPPGICLVWRHTCCVVGIQIVLLKENRDKRKVLQASSGEFSGDGKKVRWGRITT